MTRRELCIELGKYVKPVARENLGAFLKGGDLFLNYEWVRSWLVFGKFLEDSGLDFRDGQQGIEIIYEEQNHEDS